MARSLVSLDIRMRRRSFLNEYAVRLPLSFRAVNPAVDHDRALPVNPPDRAAGAAVGAAPKLAPAQCVERDDRAVKRNEDDAVGDNRRRTLTVTAPRARLQMPASSLTPDLFVLSRYAVTSLLNPKNIQALFDASVPDAGAEKRPPGKIDELQLTSDAGQRRRD